MDFKTILFYAFALIMIMAATRVITARNPVHAVLFLVLSFFSAAGIWMLLQAEFLAIVLVLVYVGAVMVLFLFVVMMLDINIDRMREGFWGYLPLSVTVGVIIVLEMAAVLWHGFRNFAPSIAPVNVNLGGTKELGLLIYTKYVLRLRNRRRRAAGGHRCRRCTDPAQAQGHQAFRSGRCRARQAQRPPEDRQDGRGRRASCG